MQRILAWPNWNLNPYLNMLFLEARARDWEVYGGRLFEELVADLVNLEVGDVVHIHWTSPFEAAIDSAEGFRERTRQLRAALELARSRGVRVLWTIHNLIAHDAAYVECEIELATVLEELADRILILNPRTVEMASSLYSIRSDKVFHLPHPSYLGVYQFPTREQARRELELDQSARVVGFVGALRPYKGVAELVAAARLLGQRRSDIALSLAGQLDPAVKSEIETLLPLGVAFHHHFGRLSDTEMALWTAAPDVIALPFRNILNSGSLNLAASAGVPVVLPRLEHLHSQFGGQKWVTFYDPSDDREQHVSALADAIESSLSEYRREAALNYARRNTAFDQSVRYADLLEDLS